LKIASTVGDRDTVVTYTLMGGKLVDLLARLP
jgi:hypothetical protein